MKTKLKPIPNNTVVHTPTEAEAKELLAILHENGHKWCGGASLIEDSEWYVYEVATCYFISSYVEFENIHKYNQDKLNPITLAEFKERYCEEEKPRETDIDGKFHCGDKVITTAYCPLYGKSWIGTVVQCHESDVDVAFGLRVVPHVALCDLELYTEHETKPIENMETKDYPPYLDRPKTVVETPKKELNLCELLQGHEGEIFYSLIEGDAKLKDLPDGLTIKCGGLEYHRMGHLKGRSLDGAPLLFPSRALYKQYPLDPYTAWMKWQEEQKKIILQICYAPLIPDNIPLQSQQTVMANLNFRTPADRDKCIEEIKAIIGKYSKK